MMFYYKDAYFVALAAVGDVVFKFWRESRNNKKRPRK